MKTIKVKAVLITDGETYFIHGTSGASPATMMKAMQPLWDFDPSTENAHYVEIEVKVPEWEHEMDGYDNSVPR